MMCHLQMVSKQLYRKKKTYMYRYVFVYLSVNKAANKLRKHIFIQIFYTKIL